MEIMNEEELTITLQEATNDYINAYEEFQRYKQFYENDCDVYHAILGTYFPDANITISGNIASIIISSANAKHIRSSDENEKEFEDKLALISDDVSIVECVNGALFVLLKL